MPIKSETIAKLLFKSAFIDRFIEDTKIFSDVDLAEKYRYYLENTHFDSPIEQIMFGILANCKNGYIHTSCISDDERHFFYCSKVECQKPIGKYKCDFVVTTFVDEKDSNNTRHYMSKLAIECDGHDFHEKTKEQVARDKKRDRFFVSEGYKLLRYSGSEIYNNFESIIDEITEILENDVNKWEKENYKTFRRILIGDKVE